MKEWWGRVSQKPRKKLKKSSETESVETREAKNRGQLILDATCAPVDINYSNDLGFLNKARVKIEKIIDTLYEPLKVNLDKKPKTYRNLARISNHALLRLHKFNRLYEKK